MNWKPLSKAQQDENAEPILVGKVIDGEWCVWLAQWLPATAEDDGSLPGFWSPVDRIFVEVADNRGMYEPTHYLFGYVPLERQ